MKYNKQNPLRVVTLCSGYDSQCLALERLKRNYPEFDYELIAWAEFDPETPNTPVERQPAVIAHNALFPQWKDRNLGDMTKIDWTKVDDFDLLFYSTPCQSISQAGLQHGFAEGSGTRSSIIWNVRDAVQTKRPKYLCLENVKAMVSGKFVGMFNLWQRELERMSYVNFAQVLDSKHYGVPQHRERIFLVSIRADGLEELEGNVRYYFPKPFPLERRLKDVLEENVDEKYYLSDKMLEYFQRVNDDKSHGHNFTPKTGGGTAFALRTAPGTRVDDNFVFDNAKFKDTTSDKEGVH
jgi:DNA (cytosine-5)-methyltransferase 1